MANSSGEFTPGPLAKVTDRDLVWDQDPECRFPRSPTALQPLPVMAALLFTTVSFWVAGMTGLRYRTSLAQLRPGGGAEPSQAGPRSPARAAAARSAPAPPHARQSHGPCGSPLRSSTPHVV